jgi:predicted ABC-type ATPase
MKNNLYIIAGCNGAGKSTVSFTILPEILDCKEFVNADEIARGLSPFQPEKVAISAGRIMLNRINELIEKNQNFAFETTLATISYKSKVIQAQQKGYKVTLLFFWLQSVDLAIERVRNRVKEGGHTIDTEIIKSRYSKGIQNLFNSYMPIVDEVLIFDNSNGKTLLIAHKNKDKDLTITNEIKFNTLKALYNEKI